MSRTFLASAALALAATAVACGSDDPVAEIGDSWAATQQALDRAVASAWEARLSYGDALDAFDDGGSEWDAARDKSWADFEGSRALWREAKQAWDTAWDNDYAYWNGRGAAEAAAAAREAKAVWDAEEAAVEDAVDAAEAALGAEGEVLSGAAAPEAAAAAEATAQDAWLMVAAEWTAAWDASVDAWEKYAAAWQSDNPEAAEQAGAAVRRAGSALSWDTGWSAALDSIVKAWEAAAG